MITRRDGPFGTELVFYESTVIPSKIERHMTISTASDLA